MPHILAQHINSEHEKITIEEVTIGEFKGQPILVIHNNLCTQTKAQTLLDKETITWLKEQLIRLEQNNGENDSFKS